MLVELSNVRPVTVPSKRGEEFDLRIEDSSAGRLPLFSKVGPGYEAK